MPQWVRVASQTDCPSGSLLKVDAGGEDIVLANVDGDFYALLDECTHEAFPLSDGELEGTRLECIYHGAEFDVCTGKALALPAALPVKTFEVQVRGADVYVQLGA